MDARLISASRDFAVRGHVTVLGKTQSGKSYLTKRAIEKWAGGVLVVDTKRERDYPCLYLTGHENLAGIYRDLDKGAHLAYVPNPDPKKARAALERIAGDILKRRWRDLMLVVDEAQVHAPKGAPNPLDWLATQGQGLGVRLVAVTQRPAMLSHTVLTQSEQIFLFYLGMFEDGYLRNYGMDGETLRRDYWIDPSEHRYMVWDGAQMTGPFRE